MAEPKTTCQNRLKHDKNNCKDLLALKQRYIEQVINALSFISWTVYIWNNFRLERFNFAFLCSLSKQNILNHIFSIDFFFRETLETF